MFLLQPEELDLLIKRLPSVKVRTADDLFDVLQGEFQFPEEQAVSLLTSFTRHRVRVECPVDVSFAVVIVCCLPCLGVSTINYDAASGSILPKNFFDANVITFPHPAHSGKLPEKHAVLLRAA